jgi:hypothetical protein
MRRHFFVLILVAAITAVGWYTAETLVNGQEAQRATTGAPATATPRLADGHPDLNGYWYRRSAPITLKRDGESVIIQDSFASLRQIHPGTPKYKPEFVAKVEELSKNQVHEDLTYTCGPPGVPRIGPPQRIFQTAREVVILYDDLNGNFFRVIPTDGRAHRTSRPPNVPGQTDNLPIDPTPHGISVGRWEGDTLVIEARNLSADTWLGDNGLFHTEDVRVIERLTRQGNTLTWQATVEDPAVLAEPWKMNPRTFTLRPPEDEIEEAAFCEDRDTSLKQDLTYHSNIR